VVYSAPTGRAYPGLLYLLDPVGKAPRNTRDSSHRSNAFACDKQSGVGDVRPSRILCCGRPRPCPLCSRDD